MTDKKLNYDKWLQFGGSGSDIIGMTQITPEVMRKNMTDAEWTKIYQMNRDKKLLSNLIGSLFPSIHGNDQVKKGTFLVNQRLRLTTEVRL